jgi:hypothetical protein
LEFNPDSPKKGSRCLSNEAIAFALSLRTNENALTIQPALLKQRQSEGNR